MKQCWIKRRATLFFVVFLVPASAAEAANASARLQPSDLTYLGAFRLPEVTTDLPAIWDWGGQAMTYDPEGDPGGGSDGFPGSLFATGIDTHNYVSEISIPVPSTSRDLGALNVATTLQELADVREGLFASFSELPQVGMEYLPAQAGQASGRLYLAWGEHLHDFPVTSPTHAWCDRDLAQPATHGAWWIGDAESAAQGFIYSVNGYLFAIPDAWAEAHVGGMKLATGRFRDGGWGGMGPSLIACAPWLDGTPPGTPPPPGTELAYRPLLLYSHTRGDDPTNQRLNAYSHADVWNGGAWLTAGGKAAVVFAGSKGSGYTWYGFYTPDPVAAPPLFAAGAPCPHTEGEVMCYQPDGVTPCTAQELRLCAGAGVELASRGWWSSRFDAQLIFYDPDDLAAVAAGTMAPGDPQPYATLDLDEYLFLNATMPDVTIYFGRRDQRTARLGEPAWDGANGLLYLPELFADEYRPVVHVFRVEAGAGAGCVAGPTTLCLNGNRFRVEAEWRDFAGHTGTAQVAPVVGEDSGLFWFFDPENWEMLVKVLDGCGVNDRYWVFSAATTNVEYTLRVTDTETSAVRVYRNPLGTSAAAVTDTSAFAACP